MRIQATILLLTLFGFGAHAQTYAANEGYRVCPTDITQIGRDVVRETCGSLIQPNFSGIQFTSIDELQQALSRRDEFQSQASVYSDCVNRFVESFRRPGAPADSKAPDQAACAHSWAQDQATNNVREFGKACITYADRSLIDNSMEVYDGQCYLAASVRRG